MIKFFFSDLARVDDRPPHLHYRINCSWYHYGNDCATVCHCNYYERHHCWWFSQLQLGSCAIETLAIFMNAFI